MVGATTAKLEIVGENRFPIGMMMENQGEKPHVKTLF
jgi:hypothetical protein